MPKRWKKGYPFEWISEARAARVLENYCHLSGHPPGHPVGILGHPASFFGHPGFWGLPGPSATIQKHSRSVQNRSRCIRPNYPFIILKGEKHTHTAVASALTSVPRSDVCTTATLSRILESPSLSRILESPSFSRILESPSLTLLSPLCSLLSLSPLSSLLSFLSLVSLLSLFPLLSLSLSLSIKI